MRRVTWKSKPSFFLAILLIGMLVLSGCNNGGPDNSGANPAPTVADTPTPEVLVVVTPTSEAVATETTTETGTITDTEGITPSETMTGTEDLTPIETVTSTETMTDTGVAPSGVMTSTESMTPSATMTATENMTGTNNMTGTGSISGTAGMSGTGMSNAQGMLIRASTLNGYDFVNQDGQISGNVSDFLVDVSTGNVLFAFVEYGGLLDIGDKNLVMPLSAFQLGDQQLILNFNEQELQNFPDVGDNWPDLSDPNWDNSVADFWRGINIEPGVDFNETNSSNVMWLSDMNGYTVADMGSGAGTIQDMLIDLGSSRIKYVLFDFGTAANQDPYIIPYSALDVQNMANNQIALNSSIDAAMLQTAPRYDQNLYPNDQVLTQDFSTVIDQYWADHGFSTNQ